MGVRLAKSVMALSLIAMVAVPLAVLAADPAPLPSVTGTACVTDTEFQFHLEANVGTSGSATDTNFRGSNDLGQEGFILYLQLSGDATFNVIGDNGVVHGEIAPANRRWASGVFDKTISVQRVMVHEFNDYYVTQMDGVILHGANPYVSGDTWTAQAHDRATGTTYSSEITITDCAALPTPGSAATACVTETAFQFDIEGNISVTSPTQQARFIGFTDKAQQFDLVFNLLDDGSYKIISGGDAGVFDFGVDTELRFVNGTFPWDMTVTRLLTDGATDYYFVELHGEILNGPNPYASGDTWTATVRDPAGSAAYRSDVTITDCVTVPPTTVPPTTVPPTTVPPTTVPPTTVPPTTTIPIDVGDTGGDSLPATGASEDLTRTAKAGIAFLLFGFTFLAASREARVVWKDQ